MDRVRRHVKGSSVKVTSDSAGSGGRFDGHRCRDLVWASPLVALALVFLALPAAASAECENEAIRAAQTSDALPNGTTEFPDCMALEKVSATKKENQYAKYPDISIDEERIRYYSGGAIEDPHNLLSAFWNRYVAARGESGWASTIVAPADPAINVGLSFGSGDVFSPDFTRWFHFAATTPQGQLGRGTIYQGGLGGLFEPVSPLLVPVDQGIHGLANLAGAAFQGASADHSHLYLRAGENRSVGSVPDIRTAYLPGDPEPVVNTGAQPNAYIISRDSGIELLARDRDGKAWGGNCGAAVGGIGAAGADRNQGAIAADGSRVYFTTRPDQPADGNCSGVNQLRIMRRVETSSGPEITHLVPNGGAGECDRVSPPCATSNGADLYQGASVDGARVYFTTNRQLANSDLDGALFGGCTGFLLGGCDLYLYDSTEEPGQQLIQVSAGEDNAFHEAGKEANVLTGIPAISGDGSRVYFVAEGVLTDQPNPEGAVAQPGQKNLYIYERDEDHPDGRLAFIGTGHPGDVGSLWSASSTFRGPAYPVPVTGKDAGGREIGGDGHILLFQSKAPFTADDTDGGFSDVFRYDSQTETLERVTKAAQGGEDNGPFDLGDRFAVIGLAPLTNTNGTDFAEMGRWASEDGQTVVFKTKEKLVPGLQGDGFRSYLLRGGELYALPGTRDPFVRTDAAALNDRPVLSHDGSVVAFTSREALLPADGDSAIDVYALRAGGGYELEQPPHICSGEECQGPAGAPPGSQPIGSASIKGGGNLQPAPSCAAQAKRARVLTRRAKRLNKRSRQARSAGNARTRSARKARKARNLARRAKRISKRAQALQKRAKRCRRANRGAGR